MIFEAHSIRMYKIYSVLFLLLFSPSLFYVTLNASSMAAGLFFTTIYILIVIPKKLPLVKFNVETFLWFLLLAAFIFHFIVSSISDFHNFSTKYLFSFLLISFLLLTAAFLSIDIRKLRSLDLIFI